MRITPLLVTLASLATGCASSLAYETTTADGRTLTSRVDDPPAPCAFDVVALPPAGYAQIGIADRALGSSSIHATTLINSAAEFRKAIGSLVCAVHADAVVGEVNGFGYYVRAVFLKRTATVSAAR